MEPTLPLHKKSRTFAHGPGFLPADYSVVYGSSASWRARLMAVVSIR